MACVLPPILTEAGGERRAGARGREKDREGRERERRNGLEQEGDEDREKGWETRRGLGREGEKIGREEMGRGEKGWNRRESSG